MAGQERNQGRVDRIVVARAKLLAKLEDHPEHEKASRWKAKVGEFEESLRNFHVHGQETKPKVHQKDGVSISVPLDELGITAHAPGD